MTWQCPCAPANGVVMALEELGIDVTTIIEGLGIVGLALGFAAKDTLSNIIAGFFLFWDKPFVIGDLIEVNDEYGEVRESTMRTTRIVTVDGKLVSIPNSVIVNSKTRSYTMTPHLRLDIDVTIGVEERIADAREVILNIVRGDERFLSEPSAEVVVIALGDYFVKIELKVWLRDPRIHIPVREELREAIKNALDKAGILMPYETIELVKHDSDQKLQD
jgi:small conductance mechanosensitive channel